MLEIGLGGALANVSGRVRAVWNVARHVLREEEGFTVMGCSVLPRLRVSRLRVGGEMPSAIARAEDNAEQRGEPPPRELFPIEQVTVGLTLWPAAHRREVTLPNMDRPVPKSFTVRVPVQVEVTVAPPRSLSALLFAASAECNLERYGDDGPTLSLTLKAPGTPHVYVHLSHNAFGRLHDALGPLMPLGGSTHDRVTVVGARVYVDDAGWEDPIPELSWSWNCLTPRDEWNSQWAWWRKGHANLTELLLGKSEATTYRTVERYAWVPLPEGSYRARLTFTERWWRYRRFPWHTRRAVLVEYDLSEATPPDPSDKGPGISGSMLLPDLSVGAVVGKLVAMVLKARGTATGDTWVPPASEVPAPGPAFTPRPPWTAAESEAVRETAYAEGYNDGAEAGEVGALVGP